MLEFYYMPPQGVQAQPSQASPAPSEQVYNQLSFRFAFNSLIGITFWYQLLSLLSNPDLLFQPILTQWLNSIRLFIQLLFPHGYIPSNFFSGIPFVLGVITGACYYLHVRGRESRTPTSPVLQTSETVDKAWRYLDWLFGIYVLGIFGHIILTTGSVFLAGPVFWVLALVGIISDLITYVFTPAILFIILRCSVLRSQKNAQKIPNMKISSKEQLMVYGIIIISCALFVEYIFL
jgi:hypothetical protein